MLSGPGGALLSRILRCSTIGAEGFNGRVRNGIGLGSLAIATRPAKHVSGSDLVRALINESDQADRAISTGKLMHCCTSTPGLSTWWSSTALKGSLVLRWVSRLDAFSGYPDRT